MAAITVDGTALDCSDGGEGEPIPIGQRSRAFAGNDRNSIRGQKRQFSATTIPVVQATWDAVQSSTEHQAHITVSGTILSGGSMTAAVRANAKAVPGSSPQLWIISLQGEEV